jgi:hypothetical protein
MTEVKISKSKYAKNIRSSGFTIYDPIEIGNPNLWIPSAVLENILDLGLRGISLLDLPLRTRSKIVKQHICKILGYPVPTSFKKTQPRFFGQLFDTYIQKSNNLQIWNEELAPTRRYVLIRVSNDDKIQKVKVVTGETLALLDTTGTLTQKYQARCIPGESLTELISERDTDGIISFLNEHVDLTNSMPTDYPKNGELIPIQIIYNRISSLIGKIFDDTGYDQDRNRGALLQKIVCASLGYLEYKDTGQFPDIPHQLLELKLQTSQTIDLGLVCPDSNEPLDIPMINGNQIKHCDIRYAVFYGERIAGKINLTHLIISTGKDFFKRFTKFEGKTLNKKLQIPLPRDFFGL